MTSERNDLFLNILEKIKQGFNFNLYLLFFDSWKVTFCFDQKIDTKIFRLFKGQLKCLFIFH